MTEHTADLNPDRLAAHERLSTGALASWMRACASRPWRVVVAWLGIIVLLVVLVATVGGSLKDEFEIPGSDTQKATDLMTGAPNLVEQKQLRELGIRVAGAADKT